MSGVLSAPAHMLLGMNLILWHIFSLLVRWAGALAFWWGLRGLWPERRFATTAIVLLFVVYPGFLQQPLSSYWGWHMSLLLAAVSIAAMVRAARAPTRARWLTLTAVALLSGLAYMLLLEAFMGLEGLRLILLWFVSGGKDLLARAADTWRRWLPYLIMTTVFLVWRIVFFTSTRVTTDVSAVASTYVSSPLKTLVGLPINMIRGFAQTTVLAWFVPAGARLSAANRTAFIVSVFFGLVGGAAVVLYFRWLRKRELPGRGDETKEAGEWAKRVVVVGIMAVFFALIPMGAVGRFPELLGGIGSLDRYTLPAMIGASLAVVGAIHLVMRPGPRVWVLAVLVGLSVATHFNNSNVYREGWKLQRDLWWQLYWRAPQIEHDTVLVLQSVNPVADYEIWGPAGLIYGSQDGKPLLWGLPLDEDHAQSVRVGENREKIIRKVTFQADLGRSLVLAMPDNASCLRVLDGKRIELPASADSLLRSVASYSRIDLIRASTAAAQPPKEVFGKEPAGGWCYYFEKADLARQMADWPRVGQLGDEAGRLGLRPTDPTEWLPFVEGYASLGRYDEARALVKRAVEALPRARRYDETSDTTQGMPVLRENLCGLRDRLGSAKAADPARAGFVAQLGADLACSSG